MPISRPQPPFATAFKDLIISPLRQLGGEPETDTHSILTASMELDGRGNPIVNKRGRPQYKIGERDTEQYDLDILSKVEKGQGCYGSEEEVLWYCYCYMRMHMDALQAALKCTRHSDAKELQKCLVSTRRNLLLIDIGCGPMTAGLAVAEWYFRLNAAPINMSYIGIDPSAYCRAKAREFGQRQDLINLRKPLRLYPTLGDCKDSHLANRITGHSIVVFTLSYVFGQKSCSSVNAREIARFISTIVTRFQPDRSFIMYTNALRETVKYNAFRTRLHSERIPQEDRYRRRVYRGFADRNTFGLADAGFGRIFHVVEEI